MNLLSWIVVLVALGYGGVLLHVYLTQQRRVYFPSKKMLTTPAYFGLRYEAVNFPASDGVVLHGWFLPHDYAERVVLFCHGNRGNISQYMETLVMFQQMRVAVFVFDYRGYGLSGGSPDEAGTYADVEAAWSYLTGRRGLDSSDIIVMGRSLGAAIASHLATRHSPRALILESTFTSLPVIAAEHHPLLPVSLLSRYHYPVLENVKRITCPLLVIHSREDEVIPFAHAERLYEAARGPKTLLTILGNHHQGYLASGCLYRDGLEMFLRNN